MDYSLTMEKAFSFALHFSFWQQLGLAFLLGSFAVATLSDLKRLSAQREFLEVWVVFVLVVLAYDAYEKHRGLLGNGVLAAKWGFIAVLSLLSWKRVGVLFRLAIGDVAALAAAASLLTPLFILIFYAVAKVIALVVGPALSRGRPAWPFMPVVSLATLVMLLAAVFST